METGQNLQGFIVKDCTDLPELPGKLWQLEHERSGARLVWLEREEENKTFGIAFQTQPWDDTGVFHILEHSVLCGSERYPVKEPFVELMKSSLNTFLNAMTFPDKTFYPVSSRNGQDFINLMRVYMDAVLHPLIHSKPEIFGQEGWHYELAEDGTACYKGVVFNEMKGAFASPDTLLEGEMNRRLFPDTCYRYVSGGDPAHIPELTYESFAAAHKRLYHPSNSYIFLDGRVDIGQVLSILDGEFLSAYDRTPIPGPIAMQRPVDGGTAEISYELSPQEGLEGRARLAQGFVACTFRDRAEQVALRALADALCGDNCAPLKRRLLEAGLAKDVLLSLRDGVRQPWVLLEARDVDEGRLDAVSAALRDELEKLVRGGLDHQRILATLDNLEFQMRERDYGSMPQGLAFGLNVLESWLYGGDPAANLTVGTLFDDLRQKCGEGWFEALLERTLLKNPHTCRVVMRPSHTIGRERQAQEAVRLQAAQSAWSETETAQIRTAQANIEVWQNTPDTPEQLASIPMLRLDQIPAEPEELPMREERMSGLTVLRHEVPSGGITYLNLYFALDDMTPEQLAKTSFLCRLLGSLDTAGHGLEELQREIRSRFGNLNFSVESYGGFGRPEQCRTFLTVSCSVLDGKVSQAVALLAEIVTGTVLDGRDKVYALLCQLRAGLTEQAAMAGHMFAMNRVLACDAAEGVVREHTGGIACLQWLKMLESGFQDAFPALAGELAALARTIFTRSRLTLSVTGMDEGAAGQAAALLADRLPAGSFVLPDTPSVRPWGKRKEGIVIPVDVSFAAMGGAFPMDGLGAAKVMGRMVSLAYLWNAVRVQGGAYGVGMGVRDNGTAGFYSYRDPSADRTLGCYRQSADFLEGARDMDLTGFILGAIAESDPLLTPKMKGRTADARWWRGITREDLCRIRREMLDAGLSAVDGVAAALRRAAADGSVCILGSQRQVDACAGELDSVFIL